MELYHGGVGVVISPDVNFGRDNLDFGKGFYLTDILSQATEWAEHIAQDRNSFPPIVNVYDFDKDGFLSAAKYKIFDGYDSEWLDFVVRSRLGEKPWNGYDYIEGSIADDKVLQTVRLYMGGFLTAREALGRLKYEKSNNQICILNQGLLNKYLSYKKHIVL